MRRRSDGDGGRRGARPRRRGVRRRRRRRRGARARTPRQRTEAPAATEAPAGTEAPATTGATEGTDAPAGTEAPAEECETTDSIRLQLQWVTQAQFAGYFAADDQGYYEARCLEVELIESARRRHAAAAARRRLGRLRASPGCRRRWRHARQGADIVNIAQMLPALGHAAGVLRRRRHHVARRLRRQEHRQLGLRQRVRGLRRPGPGGPRPGQRRHPRVSRTSTCSACCRATSTPPRR